MEDPHDELRNKLRKEWELMEDPHDELRNKLRKEWELTQSEEWLKKEAEAFEAMKKSYVKLQKAIADFNALNE